MFDEENTLNIRLRNGKRNVRKRFATFQAGVHQLPVWF